MVWLHVSIVSSLHYWPLHARVADDQTKQYHWLQLCLTNLYYVSPQQSLFSTTPRGKPILDLGILFKHFISIRYTILTDKGSCFQILLLSLLFFVDAFLNQEVMQRFVLYHECLIEGDQFEESTNCYWESASKSILKNLIEF